jgi:hypothetical protein
MRLELVRDAQVEGTKAVPGRLYVDGEFFGYTLENSDYIVAPGSYTLFSQVSPTFERTKVYLRVPGRSGIMFHGGNHPEQSIGCILLASSRPTPDTIFGDKSDVLAARFAADAPDAVKFLTITNQQKINTGGAFLLLAGIAAAVYYLSRKR